MKEEEDENVSNYKIMKVNDKQFILANDQEISVWDLDKESKNPINLKVPASPSMIELMGKDLLVAESWIKSYDFYEISK